MQPKNKALLTQLGTIAALTGICLAVVKAFVEGSAPQMPFTNFRAALLTFAVCGCAVALIAGAIMKNAYTRNLPMFMASALVFGEVLAFRHYNVRAVTEGATLPLLTSAFTMIGAIILAYALLATIGPYPAPPAEDANPKEDAQ